MWAAEEPKQPNEKPLDQVSIMKFENLQLRLEKLDLERQATDRERNDLINALCSMVGADTASGNCRIDLQVTPAHPAPTVSKVAPAPQAPSPAAPAKPAPDKK